MLGQGMEERMRSTSLFGEGIGGLLVACALVSVGCSGTPTQPTRENAATSQSTESTAAAPGQSATAGQADAASSNPTDLINQGWSCRPSPVPNLIGCSHPNQGFPSPSASPEDRPATFTLLAFDTAGNFVGTWILLRADLYHGQRCESTREPYIFRSLIGYYECLHTAGN
jgi:hypothetical protein